MSRKKLEKVLELMISEERDKASNLLHDIFVEKSREIYADLIDEDNVADLIGDDEFDELDTEYVDDLDSEGDFDDWDLDDDDFGESLGTDDVGDDFLDDIETHEDEVDAEEYFGEDDEVDDAETDLVDGMSDDDDFGGEEDFAGDEDLEGDTDAEDKFVNVEDALADLRAEFDRLTGAAEEDIDSDEFSDEDDFETDEYDADEDFEGGDEEDLDEYAEDEDLEETAKLSKVSVNQKDGTESKESPVAKIRDKDAKPFSTDTKEEAGSKAEKPKEQKVKGPQEQGGKLDRKSHKDEIK